MRYIEIIGYWVVVSSTMVIQSVVEVFRWWQCFTTTGRLVNLYDSA